MKTEYMFVRKSGRQIQMNRQIWLSNLVPDE